MTSIQNLQAAMLASHGIGAAEAAHLMSLSPSAVHIDRAVGAAEAVPDHRRGAACAVLADRGRGLRSDGLRFSRLLFSGLLFDDSGRLRRLFSGLLGGRRSRRGGGRTARGERGGGGHEAGSDQELAAAQAFLIAS